MADRTSISNTSKVYFTGTHRTRLPEHTWEVMRPHLATYGVTRVADVTGLDVIGIPVCMAVRPLSRSLSVSQGKGQSLLLAKISAAMECIELWHAENSCPPPYCQKVPAAELGLPYRLHQVGVHRGSLVSDQTSFDWLMGTGLVSGRPQLVPREAVHLSRNAALGWSPLGIRNGSNGLASGNDIHEATLHALYELLERDSLGILTPAPTGRIDLDPATVSDPNCAELIEKICAADCLFEITMVPNRWGIPCFLAYLWSYDHPVFSIGSGVHSSVDVALSRAITEAAQSRLTAISGSRDDLAPLSTRVWQGSGRKPSGPPEVASYQDIVATDIPTFADVAAEVSWIARRVADVTEVEPIMVDLSTSDDFAVCKVVAPGLRMPNTHAIPRPQY
jgi:ribosomal protein S12 methylthiotransferase accessory factor